jgi:hypothetical protein
MINMKTTKLLAITIAMMLVATAIAYGDTINPDYVYVSRIPDTGRTVAIYQPPGQQGRTLSTPEIQTLPQSTQIMYAKVQAGVIEGSQPPPPAEQGATGETGAQTPAASSGANPAQPAAAPATTTPQLQTYQGVQGQYYPAAETEEGVSIVLDSRGSTHYLSQDFATGQYTELQGQALSDFEKDHATELSILQSQVEDTRIATQGYISTFVANYQIYSGLAGYSSLIFDEGFLTKWRQTVNDIFCNKALGYLPLSRDCWTSQICGIYTDIIPPQDGVLFSGSLGGRMSIAAHIEGQRSLPIVTPNETSWVYTITFSVTNPLEDSIGFNVVFSGPERSATWWPSDQSLSKDSTAAAIGASALMKKSSNDYNEVCITFSESIEAYGGRSVDKICNSIVQYAGGATEPYSVAATGSETPAETTPAGAAPAVIPGGSV